MTIAKNLALIGLVAAALGSSAFAWTGHAPAVGAAAAASLAAPCDCPCCPIKR